MESNIGCSIGQRLQTLRKQNKLSQTQAAQKLGLNRSTISSYERGRLTPSIKKLKQMALLYQTSIDYIVGMDTRAAIILDDIPPESRETVFYIVDILRELYHKDSMELLDK